MQVEETLIDQHNYPAIFTLLVVILQDNGGINRIDTPEGEAHLVFRLPAHPASGFGHMESALLEIADGEDFETFAIGEQSEAQTIAERDPYLKQLHEIVNEWFKEGMPTE